MTKQGVHNMAVMSYTCMACNPKLFLNQVCAGHRLVSWNYFGADVDMRVCVCVYVCVCVCPLPGYENYLREIKHE